MILDAQTLGLLIGTVLPLLVGLVTTRVTSPAIKAIALAGLSALTGFLTELTTPSFELKSAILTWLGAFLVAVGMHYGLWKPVGATATVQDIGSGRHSAV